MIRALSIILLLLTSSVAFGVEPGPQLVENADLSVEPYDGVIGEPDQYTPLATIHNLQFAETQIESTVLYHPQIGAFNLTLTTPAHNVIDNT